MSSDYRIDPRVRALGKARLDIVRRAQDEQEFQRLWKEARHPFPFSWGDGWKHNVQYFVDDYAAEVGFFIDVLGFPVNAFSPSFAQFTSPEQDFYFTVAAIPEGALSTPAETLRLQFHLSNFTEVLRELEARSITFELLTTSDPGTPPYAGFRTPHGILVELIGEVEIVKADEQQSLDVDDDPLDATTPLDSFWAEDEWEEDDSVDLDDEEAEPEDETKPTDSPVLPAPMKERPLPVVEITYEDIIEKDDDDDEAEYDDEEPPQATKREPLPSLVARRHGNPNAQRVSLPSTDFRQLDIPLEPSKLIRTRRKGHDGTVIFPLPNDRNQRKEDSKTSG